MILSNDQLNQVCRFLSGQTFATFDGFNPSLLQFDARQQEFNLILYHTGLRFIELFEINRWTFVSGDTYTVSTAKKSNLRTITADKLTTGFARAIGVDEYYWNTVHFDSLSFYYRKNIAIHEISTGRKILNTHLFRHNIIKLMNEAQIPVPDISRFIGEQSDINTQGYINSVINFIPIS